MINSFIKDKGVSLKAIKKWCVQILEGLNYLHSQIPKIVHRDIKLANIFYDSINGLIKIGDLGLSKQTKEECKTLLGTPEYMAPELCNQQGYDEKVDIYAFGMCLCELLTGEIPYKECAGIGMILLKVSNVLLLLLYRVNYLLLLII